MNKERIFMSFFRRIMIMIIIMIRIPIDTFMSKIILMKYKMKITKDKERIVLIYSSNKSK
jgi:hypothetical protein